MPWLDVELVKGDGVLPMNDLLTLKQWSILTTFYNVLCSDLLDGLVIKNSCFAGFCSLL